MDDTVLAMDGLGAVGAGFKGDDEDVVISAFSISKIPIIVLISAYCYQKLPQKCIPPVLSMIVEMIEDEPDKFANSDAENNFDIVKSYFPSLSRTLKLIDQSVRTFMETDPSIQEENINNDIESIHRYLLNFLWKMESYDDFYSFLLSSSLLLVDPKPKLTKAQCHLPGFEIKPPNLLYSSSFYGEFISNIATGITSLSFEEGLQMWKGFKDYREETKETYQALNGFSFDYIENHKTYTFTNDNLLNDKKTRTVIYSHSDLANLFQIQVASLQKQASPLSPSLIKLLRSLSQSDRSLLPSSYQVEYLNSWRKADYDESFNSLHRYFDYLMSNKKQYFYHYALLALATLHSSFGAHKEALRAIDEAILVARENKDLDCLNYLLTWLLNFMITKPQMCLNLNNHPSRHEILDFLRSKTKETKNLSLQAISFQFDVLIALLEGADLTSIMENMIKTLYLIMNFEDSDELKSLFITACQIADTIWKRVGYSSIGRLYLDTAIEFAKEKNNEFDLILLYIRKSSDLFLTGDIEDAFELLNSVKESAQHDFSMSKKWSLAYNLLLFYLCLNKRQYYKSLILIDKMKALNNVLDDQEIYNEILYQSALFELKNNNIGKSFKIITKQLSSMKEHSLLYNNYWFIRFQIFYALIFIDYTPYPERGLSVLLSAISLAHKCSLIFNLCEGIIALCKFLLKVDPGKSLDNVKELLKLFLPSILELKIVKLVSDACNLMAEVEYLCMQKSDELKNQKNVYEILKYINISIKGYEKMFDYDNLRKILLFQLKVAENNELSDVIAEVKNKLAKLEI